MGLGKFSCINSCTSGNNTGSDDDTPPQLRHVSKVTDAAPPTSKFNCTSPDKISIKSQDSIITGTVGPIESQPHSAESSKKSSTNESPLSSISSPKPRVDLQQLHVEMKRMNEELQNLIEKREEENERIKTTLGYVKDQVEGLRASRITTMASLLQQRASSGASQLSEYIQTFSETDYNTLLWKIGATCLIMHLCISNICAKIIPKMPWVFDVAFSVLVYSHLFLKTGMIWLKNSQYVPSEVINNYQMFSQQIGAVLCGGAIVFLKLRQCSRKAMPFTTQGQLALTIWSYFVELWTPEYLCDFSEKCLLVIQVANIILWLM